MSTTGSSKCATWVLELSSTPDQATKLSTNSNIFVKDKIDYYGVSADMPQFKAS